MWPAAEFPGHSRRQILKMQQFLQLESITTGTDQGEGPSYPVA